MHASDVRTGPDPSVLVVDDDRDIREALSELLLDHGYRVHVASNGKEALLMLGVLGPPCVVVLDLMMPVMDGWEFLGALRSQGMAEHFPVVVLSANRVLPEGPPVRAALAKPFDVHELLTLIGRCGGPPPVHAP